MLNLASCNKKYKLNSSELDEEEDEDEEERDIYLESNFNVKKGYF